MSYGNRTITLPGGRSLLVPPMVLSPEEEAERVSLLKSEFFIVRQGSLGEIFRCKLCNGKHQHLTLRCCEQPFSGIDGGLVAYYTVYGRPGVAAMLRPAERARVAEISRLFAPPDRAPDLGRYHPELARQAGGIDSLGERDMSIGSIALGVLDPISKETAQRLLNRINLRGGRLTVPGLDAHA